MVYNLTGIVDNATLLSFTQGVNTTLMSGTLGIMFMVGLSILLFGAFWTTTRDEKTTIIATSMIMFMLAIPLKALSLIPTLAMFIPAIVLGLTLAWGKMSS